MNILFSLLNVDLSIPQDTIPPSSPNVVFPTTSDGQRIVSVSLPAGDTDAIAWEYSINRGDLFITGSNFSNTFSLTPGVTYFPGDILVRSKDASHNYSDVVSNSDTIVIELVPPSPPNVTFPVDTTSSVVTVVLQEDDVSVAWEYSLDSGNFFLTGSGTVVDLEAGTTYDVGQIQIRSRDSFNNYSTIVSNLNSIEVPV